jgi:hypothetical protein
VFGINDILDPDMPRGYPLGIFFGDILYDGMAVVE